MSDVCGSKTADGEECALPAGHEGRHNTGRGKKWDEGGLGSAGIPPVWQPVVGGPCKSSHLGAFCNLPNGHGGNHVGDGFEWDRNSGHTVVTPDGRRV